MRKRPSFAALLGLFIAADLVWAFLKYYYFGVSARQASTGLILAVVGSAVLAGLISAASRRSD